MPIKSGKEYIERIDKQNINIWYKGERIEGPLSQHPAFQGLIETQADLYDMQCDACYLDRMTYPSPDTGELVGLSFLPPRNAEDLQKRRIMMELWANRHHGFLGRSPDYMNTAIMALFTAADILEEHNPQYADNLRRYYAYCREHDITLSHAFIQPYASKLSGQNDDVEDSIAAKVVEINDNGMVISGAFMMATQGATCEEMLVFPTPSPTIFNNVNPSAFAFAVPNDLPGMAFICRESYGASSTYDHPLSARYEEMDTLVIFDRVLVPHDRIFYYGDEAYAGRLFGESHFHTHMAHQITTRYIVKTEFLLGLLESLADEQNVGLEPQMVLNVSKIITFLETFKALRLASEQGALHDKFGYLVPATSPLLASSILFPKFYPEMVEMIQILGSSGLIMIPSELDFDSDTGHYLDQYLKGTTSEAYDRIALFRLAWELGASSFGGRQTQFERFFFGNAHTVAYRMYNSYEDHEQLRQLINDFIAKNNSAS
ncbi:4-hydroxyphenylacetate 3-hydroxylase family protein [Paenibacillus glucanolyticus]|uniref:4-hydroxyphenylacetate 3-hydroxylase family protein n=1 Tax=Paenibacillus TaxID=44249 RepID=UPI001164A8F1|nr:MULTISPECIES: 4-hydroxyphenylacetate 3-hydroxylase N-terminal domain-containing protein [unclassified Paenibacillus]AWP27967.1 4-hydroxyphenylacetate 3-monooxygenase, oxygenase component [Paenibacillus sp. Cedars]MDH6672119.1 4-hydroxyphenylacetate 3-monooxygenase [Paenibacillus sp. LBL]